MHELGIMCGTCGCSDNTKATVIDLETGKHIHVTHDSKASHDHSYDHDHTHAQSHAAMHGTTVQLEQAILQKNDELAERNRAWFSGREILALNLVSSPGSGKTTLLESTIRALKDKHAISVI